MPTLPAKRPWHHVLLDFGEFIVELVKVVLISLVIILPVRYYLVQPFYVKGASMEPTFFDHEYLLIDEISYRFEKPERGAVVVFRYPRDPRQFFIKRCICVSG
jgi:signal peptidase I